MESKVRDLMTKNPIALDASRSIVDAARAMRDAEVGDVLITRNGRLCGIVTDRDIVVRCIAAGEDPEQTSLEEVCSSDITTLAPDDEAERAVELMREQAIRRLPVVEAGRPLGIVSLGDLAVDRDRRSCLGAISAAPANN